MAGISSLFTGRFAEDLKGPITLSHFRVFIFNSGRHWCSLTWTVYTFKPKKKPKKLHRYQRKAPRFSLPLTRMLCWTFRMSSGSRVISEGRGKTWEQLCVSFMTSQGDFFSPPNVSLNSKVSNRSKWLDFLFAKSSPTCKETLFSFLFFSIVVKQLLLRKGR